MSYERGAWERLVSMGGYGGFGYYRPSSSSSTPSRPTSSNSRSTPSRSVSRKNHHLEKILDKKFKSKGWVIPRDVELKILNDNYYNSPYRFYSNISKKIGQYITSKKNKKILVVSNNESLLYEIFLDFCHKKNYSIFMPFKSNLKNLINNLEKFERINNNLFNDYSVKLPNDFKSLHYVADLKLLSQNLFYMDETDEKNINEFLKIYREFYGLSKLTNIDMISSEKNMIIEIDRQSKKLSNIKNYVMTLEKILGMLDVKIEDLNESNMDILKNSPSLLYPQTDVNGFLSVLEEYDKANFSGILSSTYFNEFNSNGLILGIIANFKRYVTKTDDYNEINSLIIDIKNQFKDIGLNIKNLNEYDKIKSDLFNFKNVIYIDNNDFIILNNKIKEFLKLNCSFNQYLERCKSNFIFNFDSNSIYFKVNNSINNILDICSDLGINIKSLSDFDNHKKDFKILMEYVKFNKNNTVANATTMIEYTNNLFNDLKIISQEIINNIGEIDRSDLDFIIYNISTLKRLINNMGLNVSCLKEIEDSLSIILNMESDSSGDIFTSQTANFLEKEKFEIHRELDKFKSTFELLLSEFKDKSDLIYYPIGDLSESFRDQYKLIFLISTLESTLSSINSFDDIINNYMKIIQIINELISDDSANEYKIRLNNLQNEFDSIKEMRENQNYSNNQIIIENVSSYKNSINRDFNKLITEGVFSKEKINNCDVESNIGNLNNNADIIRDFIKVNGFYETDFNEILSKNRNIIQKNDKIINKIENSDIYTFYDISQQLDKSYHDYDLVKEILNLSLKLDIKEYNKFTYYNLEDVVNLSKYMENCIKFSQYTDKGIITNFNYSQNLLNKINSTIESIRKKLTDLNLDHSILTDLKLIDVSSIGGINEFLNKIDKYIQNEPDNMDETIANSKILINTLIELCNDYYIEFEVEAIKFNSSDFKYKLCEIREGMESYIDLYKIEKEICSYDELIKNNLQSIWKGPLTNIDIIKNKFDMDKEFTGLYNLGVFTSKTVENIEKVSESDLIFLDDFQSMEDSEFKNNCILTFENKDVLIPEIEKLEKTKNDDLNSYLKIFENINKIFKSSEINECITLIEFNIKHTESLALMVEYKRKLNGYAQIYYKYFGYREFDIPVENLKSKLDEYYKFNKLIDNNIINSKYLDLIYSNLNDYLKQVIKLQNLKHNININTDKKFENTDITFDEFKRNGTDNIDDANLVLTDLKFLRTYFGKKFLRYFDYVYYVNDESFNDEDRIHLFLISKNKLSYLNLNDKM